MCTEKNFKKSRPHGIHNNDRLEYLWKITHQNIDNVCDEILNSNGFFRFGIKSRRYLSKYQRLFFTKGLFVFQERTFS